MAEPGGGSSSATGFPSPFEVSAPEGAEDWREMYPYYLLFSSDRRDVEDKFWFCDSMHWPAPLFPFDALTAESAITALGVYNTRVFKVPPALGIDIRVLNGYVYISPNPVADPIEVEERVADFAERAGYYYRNWDELYAKWKGKVRAEIETLKRVEIPRLPQDESLTTVKSAAGISTAYRLIEGYNRLVESMMRAWEYHFELLNLGYVAYLDLSTFMKASFPDISDQTISQMVAGIDVLLFRPDQELRDLAKLARTQGVADILIDEVSPASAMERLAPSEEGRRWLEALESAKDPWFYFSSGTGFSHVPLSWIDDLSVPFSAIRSYLIALEKGEAIDRPLEELAKRATRLREGYAELLKTPEDKQAFREKVALACKVFPYVEEHNFFIEHWHHTVFWQRMRELGGILAEQGFFSEPDDLFFLNRYEVSQALYDLYAAWGSGSVPRGPKYWPQRIERRKAMLKALSAQQPLPALGTPPKEITEPFTVMLWGIISSQIDTWLEARDVSSGEQVRVSGHPASPGVAEGPARVVVSARELQQIEDGEILVCPITSPSWGPSFARLKGVVTNVGGMMSHAAIICREYEIPAVVGTGFGTQVIKTGQRLRIDGEKGEVVVLD